MHLAIRTALGEGSPRRGAIMRPCNQVIVHVLLGFSLCACGTTPTGAQLADVLPYQYYGGWTDPRVWVGELVVLQVTGNTFRINYRALDPRAMGGEYGRGTLRREPGRLLLHFTSMKDPGLKREAALKEDGDGFIFEFWQVNGEDDTPQLEATVVLRPDFPDFPGGEPVRQPRLPSRPAR